MKGRAFTFYLNKKQIRGQIRFEMCVTFFGVQQGNPNVFWFTIVG